LATKDKKRSPSEVLGKPSADVKAADLGELKLASSGLDLDDAKKLHMSFLGPIATSKLHPAFKALSSLKIDYLGIDGKPVSDWPKAPPFYRLRYLEAGTGFDAISAKKEHRYAQEPYTAPVAYYPGNCDWTKIADNPNVPVIITEGELKAAKACKEGFPTIGLGGVYNWRSAKLGISWLPSLEWLKWERRNIYICFDSDYKTNVMVCSALKELAEELQRRGSFSHLVNLPALDGLDKVGLDDFLVHAGIDANQQFEELLRTAEPLGMAKTLFAFNEKYVYADNPGLVVNQETSQKVSPAAFKDHLESVAQYQERKLKADGTVVLQSVSAGSAWIKWPLRKRVDKITYVPGAERFVHDKAGLYGLNTWPGWGCQPKEGDVQPFLDLLDHIFTGAESGALEWFLRWCAYPIQYPGTKLFSSAVIHGIKHGTGKSLIGYTLGRIYGKNFTEISQMDLHNGFNEWAESKQLAMGDDVTGSNKRADADFLKKLITQRELRINAKFIPSYTVPDCLNYFFTANHPDSFFLEDDDRRMFVHEVHVGPMDEQFYMEYDLWLDTGGAEAVFHYLLNLDLGNFNPAAPAFKTAAKERMISNVQSDLAGWVRSLISVPDHVLKVGEIIVAKDLFTSKELLQFYDPIGKTGTTANGLGRELARAGVRQVINGKPVRLADGSQARYYAVRNSDTWLTASISDVTAHLNSWAKGHGAESTTTKKPKY
jgi:hypothetical protein